MTTKAKVIAVARREFRFQLEGSKKVWRLPAMGSIPIGIARKLSKLANIDSVEEQADAAFELFEKLCPGLMDEVTLDQLTEIMVEWMDSSGISVGESQASSE